MVTVRTQISEIWRNRRIYFRSELGNHYYLISLLVLFTWVNHLWKFQRNLSGPTFEIEKYLLIKFCQTDFFYFSLLDRAYLYLFMCKISGHFIEVLFKIITQITREHIRMVKVAPRAQTSCRKVYRVTLMQHMRKGKSFNCHEKQVSWLIRFINFTT